MNNAATGNTSVRATVIQGMKAAAKSFLSSPQGRAMVATVADKTASSFAKNLLNKTEEGKEASQQSKPQHPLDWGYEEAQKHKAKNPSDWNFGATKQTWGNPEEKATDPLKRGAFSSYNSTPSSFDKTDKTEDPLRRK